MPIYEKWRHFLLFSKKYKNIQFLPYFSLKSFFFTFCHFPFKIKVKIQNKILRVKKLLDFIFYSKKGGLGLMIMPCKRDSETARSSYIVTAVEILQEFGLAARVLELDRDPVCSNTKYQFYQLYFYSKRRVNSQ